MTRALCMVVGVWGLACTPTQPAAPQSAAPERAEAVDESVPSAFIEDMKGKRPVEAEHQLCTNDAECQTVKADCSNLTCVGVHQNYAARYAVPLYCDGYGGPVGNYDCLPTYGSERPACENGMCASVKVDP